jgi:pimeloyl-ACP methyl ester carboxylesterase
MPMIEAFNMKGNVVFGEGERVEGRESLVFIHGAGANWTAWYHQRGYFSRDFNVFIFELPGHGAAQSAELQDIGSCARWVKGALDELKVAKPFVIGHSMGAAVAMSLALQYPDLAKALVLVGASAKLRTPMLASAVEEMKKDFRRGMESFCDVVFAKAAPPGMKRLAVDEMMKSPPQVIVHDMAAVFRFDISGEARTIRGPTLLVCGDEDAGSPVEHSRYLADQIAGSRLAIVSGAGHLPMVERADEFNKKVEDFVRSVGKGAG